MAMTPLSEPTTSCTAEIVLITAPDCHFCQDGKQTVVKLAAEFPIAVREIPWSSPEGQDLVSRHGALFPPALLFDGSFVGFGRVSQRKLRRLLEQRRSTCKR
jgi:hypothetical protein